MMRTSRAHFHTKMYTFFVSACLLSRITKASQDGVPENPITADDCESIYQQIRVCSIYLAYLDPRKSGTEEVQFLDGNVEQKEVEPSAPEPNELEIAKLGIQVPRTFFEPSAPDDFKQAETPESSIISSEDSMPNEFFCPITMEVMEDPVICADGHTYEKKAIKKWLREKKRSPKTNAELKSKKLFPNHGLKSLIQDWKQRKNNVRKSHALGSKTIGFRIADAEVVTHLDPAATNESKCGACYENKAEIRCPVANCIGAEFCKDCVPKRCPGCNNPIKYPKDGCSVM